MEAIAGTRELLVPDLVPSYRVGLEAAAREVLRLVGPYAAVDLCGLSLGGLVALRVAEERRNTQDRLTVCAGFDPSRSRRRIRTIATLMRFVPPRLLHRQLTADLAEPQRSAALEEIAPLGPAELAKLMWQAAGAEIDASRLVCKTLVLCGERDEANLPLSEQLAKRIPDASLELVPGAGHVANLDNPEAFSALLL